MPSPGGEDSADRLPDDVPEWMPTPPDECPKCGTGPSDVPDVLFDPHHIDELPTGQPVPDEVRQTPLSFVGFRCRSCAETFEWTHHSVDGRPICGTPTSTSGDPCQHPLTDDRRCRSHGGLLKRIRAATDGEYSIPEGTGSGDPGHSKGGNPDPDPPKEGNKNAVTHGKHAYENDPWGLLDYYEAERPREYTRICLFFWDWMSDAPFPVYMFQGSDGIPDRVREPLEQALDPDDDSVPIDDIPGIDQRRLTAKADRVALIALGQAVTWNAHHEQAEGGLTKQEKRISDSGGEFFVEKERPVNLPKNRARKQDLRELKELGLLDDPTSQLADGVAGWGEAAQRVAEREDTDRARPDHDQDQEDTPAK